LLERRENEGLVLIPVIIRPAAWSHVPWLRRLQVWPRDGRSLVEANPTELDRELAELAARVADLAGAVSEEMVSTDILPSPKPKQKDEVEKVAEFFISHDHSDGDFAELLKLRLEKQGHSAWIDIERLRVGEDWRQEIDNAIRSATALVVVMSPSARQSEYVTYEWAYAWGVGVPVIPILLKETSMHPRLESLQYLDFTNRSARPWDRLMDALKNTIEKRNDKSASN
jgi:hypothetical protein